MTNTIGTLLAALPPAEAHEIVRKSDGTLVTSWLSQDNGVETFGVFHPTKTDPVTGEVSIETDEVKRWGISPTKIRGFSPGNLTGAHAAGDMFRAEELAPLVLAKVFGVAVVPDGAHDRADLDFIEGASRYVIRRAAELGIVTADEAFAVAHPQPAPAIHPTAPGASASSGPVASTAATPAEDPRLATCRTAFTGLHAAADAALIELDRSKAHGPWANVARTLIAKINEAVKAVGLDEGKPPNA